MRKAIVEKRRGFVTRGILLLHNNAPVHRFRVAQASIRKCVFEQLDHQLYRDYLIPSHFYIFTNLNKHLKGTTFDYLNSLQNLAEWLDNQEESFFFSRVYPKPSQKSEKCISVRGDYVEK